MGEDDAEDAQWVVVVEGIDEGALAKVDEFGMPTAGFKWWARLYDIDTESQETCRGYLIANGVKTHA